MDLNTIAILLHLLFDTWVIEKKFQSPINIIQRTTEKVVLPPLMFENLNSSAETTIINNGNLLEAEQSQQAFLSGGPLRNRYNFDNLHFHWGKTNNEGSEHKIDDKSYAMEGHFVFTRSYQLHLSPIKMEKLRQLHFKQQCLETNSSRRVDIDGSDGNTIESLNQIRFKKNCDIEQQTQTRTEIIALLNAVNDYISSLDKTEGNRNPCDQIGVFSRYRKVASQFSRQTITINTVVGVLFAISENATRYELLEFARDVAPVNSSVEILGPLISQFVSMLNLQDYFTYSGSLTTPPYTSNVNWIVLKRNLYVSSAQLALLRQLNSADGGLITENGREVQDLNGRSVCFRGC